jgi:hypothetical protein
MAENENCLNMFFRAEKVAANAVVDAPVGKVAVRRLPPKLVDVFAESTNLQRVKKMEKEQQRFQVTEVKFFAPKGKI